MRHLYAHLPCVSIAAGFSRPPALERAVAPTSAASSSASALVAVAGVAVVCEFALMPCVFALGEATSPLPPWACIRRPSRSAASSMAGSIGATLSCGAYGTVAAAPPTPVPDVAPLVGTDCVAPVRPEDRLTTCAAAPVPAPEPVLAFAFAFATAAASAAAATDTADGGAPLPPPVPRAALLLLLLLFAGASASASAACWLALVVWLTAEKTELLVGPARPLAAAAAPPPAPASRGLRVEVRDTVREGLREVVREFEL